MPVYSSVGIRSNNPANMFCLDEESTNFGRQEKHKNRPAASYNDSYLHTTSTTVSNFFLRNFNIFLSLMMDVVDFPMDRCKSTGL
jgi:hypothetical protein